MQGFGGDNSALNGVRLQCCAKVASVTVRLSLVFETEGSPGQDHHVWYTPTITYGLLDSGHMAQSTCIHMIGSTAWALGFSGAGNAFPSGTDVHGAFTSALNMKEKTTINAYAPPAKASDSYYLYQGILTYLLADGTYCKIGGDRLAHHTQRLSTSSYNVIQSDSGPVVADPYQ